MEANYKKAVFLDLKVKTSKGLLSLTQLTTLSITELDKTAVALQEELEGSKTKSFLTEKTKENEELQLSFDIVFDILTTKVNERKEAAEKAEKKAKRDKILNLIAQKEEGAMANLSIEELKAML